MPVKSSALMRSRVRTLSAYETGLAMQQAQRAALRSLGGRNGVSYAEPYYWAGFSVSGSHP